jgi:hypothetical protein
MDYGWRDLSRRSQPHQCVYTGGCICRSKSTHVVLYTYQYASLVSSLLFASTAQHDFENSNLISSAKDTGPNEH